MQIFRSNRNKFGVFFSEMMGHSGTVPSSHLVPLPKDPTLPQEIDEFGELQRQLDLMAPVIDRHKVLKEKFEKRLENHPADQPAILRGKSYELQYGIRRNERTIVKPARVFNLLRAQLGLRGVMALIKIPLEMLDKHVPKSQQAGLVVEERSGWRKLDVVAIAPAAPPEAA